VIPGANAECSVPWLKKRDEDFRWCDCVMLQMEIPFESVLYAAKRAKELGKNVMLNLAPVPSDDCSELLPYADFLSVNETELAKLTGKKTETIEEIESACDELVRAGAGSVLATLGERGALLRGAHNCPVTAPPKVKAVDTTAAGDTFTAAFLLKFGELGAAGAVAYANAAASLAVSRKGAQSSIPDKDDVENFLRKH